MEMSVNQERANGKNYKHMTTHVKTTRFNQLNIPLQPSEPGLVTSYVTSDGSSSSTIA
jgi:hypothetical protein